MANKLPILIQDYQPWYSLPMKWEACQIVDFDNPDAGILLRDIQEKQFYTKGIPDEIFWDTEKMNFLDVVEKVLGTR